MAKPELRVILAQPRGFCAGVVRAVEIVERALEACGAPVYVRHEIVHNRHVVDGLRSKGARFVEAIEEIPRGAVTVFSAHGVASEGSRAAPRPAELQRDRCDVSLGEQGAQRSETLRQRGQRDRPHRTFRPPGSRRNDGAGVRARIHLVSDLADVARNWTPADPRKLAYVTQTTLSIDDTREIIAALKNRIPRISAGPGEKDICYATQNRQSAVKRLAERCEVILVVGARLQLELESPSRTCRTGRHRRVT